MHLDEEHIQRLLHRELPARAESAAREHVAGCGDCRRSLAEAEREENEVYTLLRAVDDPPPPIRAEAVALRAELASAAERTRGSVWLRRAAGILLAVGIAGAAYAVPGSPVRAWVHAIVQKIGGRPAPSAEAPGPGESTAGVSGIAVLPGERLLILFRSAQAKGGARVLLIDGPEVQVQAPVGSATFTSSADRLLINNQGSSATFEIRIPRSAPWLEVRVGGQRIFLKEGQRVTTSGSASAVGGYLLRLTPSGP